MASLSKHRASKVNFNWGNFGVAFAFFVLLGIERTGQAQVDCLSCHGDKTMQDTEGHSASVDGDVFKASIHGTLSCSDCHKDVKEFPHANKPAPVKCETCHSDQAAAIAGSVHASTGWHSCTSCHGNAHAIMPKDNPHSAVYPLNIPKTCGGCHANETLAKKYHLQNVYSTYMDSIHGYAVSKEGLLVAANCTSCHGSHGILSHNDPKSTTARANVPATCGACHGGVKDEYFAGIHATLVANGDSTAPVCTDCHTAHAILQPTEATFRMQTTPICGSCHKEQLATYRDTFHSQLGLLGGYVETARCWDCHDAHRILPVSDPHSPIAQANLVKTCGKCHANANASFVQYQPHANPRDRKRSPALYYTRLFMNTLLWGVIGFFSLHTVLWFIRSKIEQRRD